VQISEILLKNSENMPKGGLQPTPMYVVVCHFS